MKWINTKDRLPPDGVQVVAIYRYGVPAVMLRNVYSDGSTQWSQEDEYFFDDDEIVAWMPIPEYPCEHEENETHFEKQIDCLYVCSECKQSIICTPNREYKYCPFCGRKRV